MAPDERGDIGVLDCDVVERFPLAEGLSYARFLDEMILTSFGLNELLVMRSSLFQLVMPLLRILHLAMIGVDPTVMIQLRRRLCLHALFDERVRELVDADDVFQSAGAHSCQR